MNNAQMVKCFNEWMRRYIEEPERFEAEFETENAFLADESGGVEPTYGEACAALMERIAQELPAS